MTDMEVKNVRSMTAIVPIREEDLRVASDSTATKTNPAGSTAVESQAQPNSPSTVAGKDVRMQPPSPFEPEALRLNSSFDGGVGVRKVVTTVPRRRPHRQEFVRTHPDEDYRLQTAVLELKDGRSEIYVVARDLWAELPGEVQPVELYTFMTRQGVLGLWPVKLPGPDGRGDSWSRSAAEAAQLAMKQWVRVAANMGLGAYEVFAATGDLPEPEWPNLSFAEILKIAFRDHYVDSLDHAVCRQLRGAL